MEQNYSHLVHIAVPPVPTSALGHADDADAGATTAADAHYAALTRVTQWGLEGALDVSARVAVPLVGAGCRGWSEARAVAALGEAMRRTDVKGEVFVVCAEPAVAEVVAHELGRALR